MPKLLDLPPISGRSTGIDLLRTGLAMWVVFVHTVPWTHATNPITTLDRHVVPLVVRLGKLFQPIGETNPAVLAFIVLSGYCIHRNGLRRESMDVSSYAIRRLFRIYPTYIAAIVIGVSFYIWFAPVFADYHRIVSTDAISADCLAIKIFGLASFSPALVECAYQANAPLRTVAVEMWLYALYPIVLLVIARDGGRVLVALAAAALLTGVVVVTIWRHTGLWWHNDSILGFVAYWWIGAKAVDPQFTRRLRDRRTLWGLAAIWIGISIVVYGNTNAQPILIEVRKVAFALMFAAMLPLIDRANISIRYSDIAGRAGYSIYAFHMPIVALMVVLGSPWYVTCLAAYVVGVTMFFLIENPLDKFGRRFAKERRSVPAV